jgi:hypothetical protein
MTWGAITRTVREDERLGLAGDRWALLVDRLTRLVIVWVSTLALGKRRKVSKTRQFRSRLGHFLFLGQLQLGTNQPAYIFNWNPKSDGHRKP